MTAPLDPGYDDEIIRWLQAGDGRGVESLLRVHGRQITGSLRDRFDRRVPDSMLVDALHDAAMKLFLKPRLLERVRDLPSYVYVTALNHMFKMLKREKDERLPPLPLDAESLIAAPMSTDSDSLQVRRVGAAIANLSPLERDILNMTILSNFKLGAREIAQELGTTPEVVYSTRNRTKQKLAKFMPPSGPEERRR